MKPRQFKKLLTVSKGDRDALLIEGLEAIGSNVSRLANEVEKCNEVKAYRAAGLTRNVAREEAGKFLVLVDLFRSPDSKQSAVSRQLGRASTHLAKLIYAQMADYLIASQGELMRAVGRHRASHHLDGPNDYDWVFRNDLIAEREDSLYVDLIDSEGDLIWWAPSDLEMAHSVPRSVVLVRSIAESGLASLAGLRALESAWAGFDPLIESHFVTWQDRTVAALEQLPAAISAEGGFTVPASQAINLWPMPMVELEVEEARVDVAELVKERTARFEAEMRYEYGIEDEDPYY